LIGATLKNSPKSIYKFFATGEAITWGLLISALITRALGDLVPHAVTVAGSIHGAMFLSYCVVAVLVGLNQRWAIGRIAGAVALAVVPFATVPFDRRLGKQNALEGSWRTETSDDPRDQGFIDRLFRWFIARPVVLVLVIAIALPAIFAFLLFLGPPTEWFD
jgi:integral membrane protein